MSNILILPGLPDFLGRILNNLNVKDICNLKLSCKTMFHLIKVKHKKLFEKKVIEFIKENHYDIVQNFDIDFQVWTESILDFAIIKVQNENFKIIENLKSIGFLLNKHRLADKQNWLRAFFSPITNISDIYDYVNELDKTLLEFKYLVTLASLSILQSKHAMCIPPYFGKILSNLTKISNENFIRWLHNKATKQIKLDKKFLFSTSMAFLKNLNESHIMKPLERKLPRMVEHYRDIIFAMSNLDTLFSDQINDTIYYEMLITALSKNMWTNSNFIKFLPLF